MTVDIVWTRWSSDREEDRFVVENPATGQPLAIIQGGGAPEVDAAVRAAHAGYGTWRRRSYAERARYLRLAAARIAEHADELAALLSKEMGKPYTQARSFDLESCIGMFELMGGLGMDISGKSHDSGGILDVTEAVPYGVVAGIIPFNWPPIHASRKAAPALLMGNAVVVKPPEQGPLTVMRIVDLVCEVLPDDVLHVVPGGGASGRALAGHPLVRKVSFTGAPGTGRAVIKTAAENLVPTLMELGGKNPLLIFEDADVESAVAAAVEGGFFNQGEACTASSRILVHRSIHDEVVRRLTTAVERLKVGDGALAGTHIGPMVNKVQQQRVLEYINIGIAEGAHVAARGSLPIDPSLAGGFWVQPTVFTDVKPHMRIAQEEIFGPVVAVIPFDSEQEAIDIANGTDFGLVAGVFTGDAGRGIRVSREIEAGFVFINHYNRATGASPFGGTKHSGFGRGSAVEALKEFSYTRTLRIPSGCSEIPQWDAVAEVMTAGD